MEMKQIRVWVTTEQDEFMDGITKGKPMSVVNKSTVVQESLALLMAKKTRAIKKAELEDFTPVKTATNSSAISKGK